MDKVMTALLLSHPLSYAILYAQCKIVELENLVGIGQGFMLCVLS